MGETRRELKMHARLCMARKNPSPYLTFAVFALLYYILNYLDTNISTIILDYDTVTHYLDSGDLEAYIAYIISLMPSTSTFFMSILLSLMSTILQVGFIIYCLALTREEPYELGMLFDGFQYFASIFMMMVLIKVFTFLWGLLFIIPGIIATYSYRLAYIIKVDRPELSALQCISESKRLMKGHKLELFVIDLTLLPWMLLTMFPITMIFVLPYIQLIVCAFYNKLVLDEVRHKYD